MEQRKAIKFGTDGWRGVISDDFTFENVRIVAQAISDWLNQYESKNIDRPAIVAVGYDTRFLSKEYAHTVASVLAANSLRVVLSDRAVPTPVVSFTVQQQKLIAGVMITASHNPYNFNGIKIKLHTGAAASGEVTQLVEQLLHKNEVRAFDLDQALQSGQIKLSGMTPAYVKFLKAYINFAKLKTARFKVLIDVMHGSGNGFVAEILKKTKMSVTLVRSEINPSFGGKRPEPIPENLEETMARIKKERFDIGLVLDGDADRIAAIDSQGNFISPQKILGLFALHLTKNRKFSGGVIKTVVGTTLMDNLARQLNLKLYETPVGFKYISDLMVNEDILVGGEEAGGMGFCRYIPERDGSLAALLLLEMMAYEKASIKKIIDAMERQFGRYYYLKDSITLKDNAKKEESLKRIEEFRTMSTLLDKRVVSRKDQDGVKLICDDESWLMLRASGTEPLIRIYSEAKSLAQSKRLLAFGKKLVS